MKLRNTYLIVLSLGFTTIVLFSIFFNSCKKVDEKIMKVRNDSISDISNKTAKANATIIDVGEGINQHGHCWSTSPEPTIFVNENMTENGQINNAEPYYSILTGLKPNTKYYVTAYVKNGGSVVYGAVIQPFTTLSISLPVVTTGTISNVTTSGATVTGNLNNLGSGVSAVTQYGHCWSSETTTPIIESTENKTSLGSRDSTGNYESILVGLSSGTLYYVRAYATNDAGTAYGDALNFTSDQSSSIPSIVTAAVSSVTSTSAICGGSITSDGGSPVTAKGVCWDTDLNPTKSGNKTNDGTGTGSFASEIAGLVENTTYYVRAYATNSVGTAYGNHVSFTASDEISIPTVTTTAVTSYTSTTAVCGGNVNFDGGSDVTARGVCWNTTGTPTTSDDYTSDGSATGSFTSNITGLTENTKYYVRAYATNSVGTAYGDQVNFTTSGEISIPVVTTTAVSSYTSTTAVCGGNVTSNGGATITARGVCWNTTGNPEISDDLTTDGSSTGEFTSNITGLTESTLYYVRAYATNSVGTAYGDQVSFTTLGEAGLPAVLTTGITGYTTNSAVCGGNVTSNGGATITARGVCWNTTGNPEISDDLTTDGSGTGSFTCNLTGLIDNTFYYVRAYATNSAGTAYGDQLSFTTLYDPCSGITSLNYEGQIYSTVAIGDQCWMAENLNTGTRVNVSQDQLNNGSIEKYCYDDNEANCSIYGGIYQWDELMQYSPSDSGEVGTTQGICPSGWHIPTDKEWKTLELELGMNSSELDLVDVWRGTDEGGKLKHAGTEYWDPPNEEATNESGFTALPSGGMVDKVFGGVGYFTDYWTATEYNPNPTIGAWYRFIDADNGGIKRTAGYKPNGTPVRCIKD